MRKQKTFNVGWWRDDEIGKIKNFCKDAKYFDCKNFQPYNRFNGYETDIEKFLDVIPLTKVRLVKRVVKVWDSEPSFIEVAAITFKKE